MLHNILSTNVSPERTIEQAQSAPTLKLIQPRLQRTVQWELQASASYKFDRPYNAGLPGSYTE